MVRVAVHNRADEPTALQSIVLLPPLGLAIFPDQPRCALPLVLQPGEECFDDFDCAMVAKQLREMDYQGGVRMQGVAFTTSAPIDWVAARLGRLPEALPRGGDIERRSDPFVFNVDRWP